MPFPKTDGTVSCCRRLLAELDRTACLCVVMQEAIANGNPSLVKLVMKYRNYQRNVQRIRGIPELLRKLKEVRGARHCGYKSTFSPLFSRQVGAAIGADRRRTWYSRFLRRNEMGILQLG